MMQKKSTDRIEDSYGTGTVFVLVDVNIGVFMSLLGEVDNIYNDG